MSIPLTVNGAVFEYPVNFDENWGVDATGWAQAVTNGMLQMSGGSFPLTAEVDFGGSFGLKALYLKSRETNPASAGIVRLSSASAGVVWRNNANSGNLVLTTNAADQLLFNGTPVGVATLTDSHIFVGNGSNIPTDVAMSGDVHISNTGATTIQPGAVTNSKITGPISVANGGTNSGTALNNNRIIVSSGSAIVEASAIAANQALTSNSSGIPVANPAGVTDTQLGYLPNLFSYRRPPLVYLSGTVVSIQTGLDGTAGDVAIRFPDGQLRTETSSSRYNMNIAQNAVFTNATLGNNQGGLRTGAAAANTWYFMYAVKVTTFAANWVMVADTVTPVQANYATLNSNFGTNGWVYLGVLPYGDGSLSTTAFAKFSMSGGRVSFRNSLSSASTTRGIRLATTAGATALTWTYASGTSIGSGQIPSHLTIGDLAVDTGASSTQINFLDSGAVIYNDVVIGTSSAQQTLTSHNYPLVEGFHANFTTSVPAGIAIRSYVDDILIGSPVSQL